jgi:hypothetical protein
MGMGRAKITEIPENPLDEPEKGTVVTSNGHWDLTPPGSNHPSRTHRQRRARFVSRHLVTDWRLLGCDEMAINFEPLKIEVGCQKAYVSLLSRLKVRYSSIAIRSLSL